MSKAGDNPGSGGSNYATRYDGGKPRIVGDQRQPSWWFEKLPNYDAKQFPVRVQYERARKTGIVTKARTPTRKVRIATQARKRYQYSQNKGLRKVQRKRDDYYEAWYY